MVTTTTMIVVEKLAELTAASQIEDGGVRLATYRAVASVLDHADLVSLVAVLTEGAMHGPNFARSMAVAL